MENQTDRKPIRSPVVRMLGVILLFLGVLGSYLAAEKGDLGLFLSCVLMLFLLVPPVFFGKFPFVIFEKLNVFFEDFHKNPQSAVDNFSRNELRLIQIALLCWYGYLIFTLIS